jgi:hypothetical protein
MTFRNIDQVKLFATLFKLSITVIRQTNEYKR